MNDLIFLQNRLDILMKKDPKQVWLYLSFTAKHPKRIGFQKSIDAWTDHVKNDQYRIKLSIEDNRYFFEITHHLDQNGDGFIDGLELPNYESLENFVEVLEDLCLDEVVNAK